MLFLSRYTNVIHKKRHLNIENEIFRYSNLCHQNARLFETFEIDLVIRLQKNINFSRTPYISQTISIFKKYQIYIYIYIYMVTGLVKSE